MRAQLIRRTDKGIQLQGREGEPVQLNATTMLLIQQRQFRKRFVPLGHNFGMPIVRQVKQEGVK